jgi:hypothetical protein
MSRALKAMTVAGIENMDRNDGELVLHDTHTIFSQDKLFTEDMVAALRDMDNRNWFDYFPDNTQKAGQKLRKLLGRFGIGPTTVYIDGKRAKGYHRASFVDAWLRYCGIESAVKPLQSGETLEESVTANGKDEPAVTENAAESKESNDVTAKNPIRTRKRVRPASISSSDEDANVTSLPWTRQRKRRND